MADATEQPTVEAFESAIVVWTRPEVPFVFGRTTGRGVAMHRVASATATGMATLGAEARVTSLPEVPDPPERKKKAWQVAVH